MSATIYVISILDKNNKTYTFKFGSKEDCFFFSDMLDAADVSYKFYTEEFEKSKD